METGMIFTTTILITLCMLPFILIYGSTKQKEKQLKNKLLDAITKENGILTDFAINTDFAIGLDRNAERIYFYKATSEKDCIQILNLNKVSACEIKKETKRIRNGKSYYEIIQNIALVFIAANQKVVSEFELYDYDKNSQLNGEIALADIWKKKVIDLLTSSNEISNRQTTEKPLPVFA